MHTNNLLSNVILEIPEGRVLHFCKLLKVSAEDIKKRWQEYTEELYKKIFMTQVIRMVWSLT